MRKHNAEKSNKKAKSASVKKKLSWKGRLFLISFSLFMILILEGVLRLVGFGGHAPLWEEALTRGNEGSVLFQTNPDALSPFFSVPTKNGKLVQGSMRIERVLMPKPKPVLRVVVVGESSVEGFPYPRNLTSVAFLEAYLQPYFPEKKVEVLNLGVTAIASFPVRIVAEQTLDVLDPDLLIVYTGHNEFFGAFGVASHQFGGNTLLGQQFVYQSRSLAMMQALAYFSDKLRQRAKPKDSEGRQGGLIEVMAARDQIEPGGALHKRAGKIFRGNLKAIIDHAKKKNVPVLLATIIGNESGMQPVRYFENQENAVVSYLDDEKLENISTAELDKILSDLKQQEALRPLHAKAAYWQARIYEKQGKRELAREAFIRARDLDAMPWRAPSFINQVIREVAQSENVSLVDIEAIVHAIAGGAIGWNYMADHLHPNLQGQALLAETLCKKIVEANLLGESSVADRPLPDRDRMAQMLGANTLEEIQVLSTMAHLFQTPPLGRNNASAAAYLQKRMQSLLDQSDSVEKATIEKWKALRAQGGTPSISFLAGIQAMEAGQFQRAAYYFVGSRGSMTPFGIARIRSQYLGLLSIRQLVEFGPPQKALLNKSLAELKYAKLLTEDKNLGQYFATLGGLTILAGNHEQGMKELDRAAQYGFKPGPTEGRMLERILNAVVSAPLDSSN